MLILYMLSDVSAEPTPYWLTMIFGLFSATIDQNLSFDEKVRPVCHEEIFYQKYTMSSVFLSEPDTAPCPGYWDANGFWNNGFECLKRGRPNQKYCCGTETEPYCCPPEKVPDTGHLSTQWVQKCVHRYLHNELSICILYFIRIAVIDLLIRCVVGKWYVGKKPQDIKTVSTLLVVFREFTDCRRSHHFVVSTVKPLKTSDLFANWYAIWPVLMYICMYHS